MTDSWPRLASADRDPSPWKEVFKQQIPKLARLVALVLLLSPLIAIPSIDEALAEHRTDGGTIRNLQVEPETDVNPAGFMHTLTATVVPTSTTTTNIDFEIESGPGDMDGDTPDSPDMTCNIEPEEDSCSVSYTATTTGTDTIRAWIDHGDNNDLSDDDRDETEGRISDAFAPGTCSGPEGQLCPPQPITGTDTSTDCPPGSDESQCEGTEEPGSSAEPDSTDVVEKTWTVGPAAMLDCDDSNPSQPESSSMPSDEEVNPVSGTGSTETYTCTLTDEFGNPVTGTTIDAENMAGANDPDNSSHPGDPSIPGPNNNTADYDDICTTDDSNGTCTATIAPAEGETGTAHICFWADSDDDDEYNTSSVADGSDCRAEQPFETENNDTTDKVIKHWEERRVFGLDVQPEMESNLVGTTHTLTATVYDQFGATVTTTATVNFEFFSGSPADPDPTATANSPTTPDGTCSTAGGSTCTFQYTSSDTGTDLICGWIAGDTPTMAGTSPNGTCDGEPREDETDDDGPPSPPNDSVDVVSKTWVTEAAIAADVEIDMEGCDGDLANFNDASWDTSATNRAGDVHEVCASAKTAHGTILRGHAVTFTSTGVGHFASTGTANHTDRGQSTTAVIGEDGYARVWIHSDEPGTQTVTASKDNASDSGVKTWQTGAARTIELRPEFDRNPTGTAHVLTATARDRLGNPVSGAVIAWQQSGPASFTGQENVTDQNGEANATITSATEGTSTVTATMTDADPATSGNQTSECSAAGDPEDPNNPAGNCSDSAEKAWQTTPAATSLTLEPPSATNNVGENHFLTALVEDQHGEPMEGVLVRFRVTGTHTLSGTDATDENGVARFGYEGSNEGEDQISAFADSDEDGIDDGDEPSDTATKTWTRAEEPAAQGYWMVATDGGIFTFGAARFHGSTGDINLNSPIVGMDSHPDGQGYWLVAADGGIFAFGSSAFYGSMGGTPLNRPVVGMASTPSGNGYWMVASDGGIFSFGDASFHGSTGNINLNSPIVAMASTESGQGYWLFAADGGVFAFGDATFHGSMGGTPLNRPILGADNTQSGGGYWMTASDGGIFSFGDASFHGSTGNINLNSPVVGMSGTPDDAGYWLGASDGGVFAFGNAQFHGSMGAVQLNRPVVGIEGLGS